MRSMYLLALLTGLGSLGRDAGPQEGPNGWPDTPQAADSGTFAVVQFATTDPHRVVEAWKRPTPGVKIKITHEARLGQPLSTFINFRNCRADASGACQVTAYWKLIGPDGRVKVSARSKVRVGLPPPRHGAMGLSTEAPEFIIRPSSGPGRYLIKARTTDHVAKITLQTEDAITVRR